MLKAFKKAPTGSTMRVKVPVKASLPKRLEMAKRPVSRGNMLSPSRLDYLTLQGLRTLASD